MSEPDDLRKELEVAVELADGYFFAAREAAGLTPADWLSPDDCLKRIRARDKESEREWKRQRDALRGCAEENAALRDDLDKRGGTRVEAMSSYACALDKAEADRDAEVTRLRDALGLIFLNAQDNSGWHSFDIARTALADPAPKAGGEIVPGCPGGVPYCERYPACGHGDALAPQGDSEDGDERNGR